MLLRSKVQKFLFGGCMLSVIWKETGFTVGSQFLNFYVKLVDIVMLGNKSGRFVFNFLLSLDRFHQNVVTVHCHMYATAYNIS
jgi:hypothetical protein